jgi:hypothetical protein
MNQNSAFLSILGSAVLAAVTANAQVTLFADNFETGNLNQWTGKSGSAQHGQIVSDPLNPTNHVLNFTAVGYGGDIFSAIPATADPRWQHLKLSFDFLALPNGGVPPSEYGGFAGIATDNSGLTSLFMAGTYLPALDVPPPVGVVLATDGKWRHYEIDYTSVAQTNDLTKFLVTLEDWSGRGSVPGDVYFDNVKLTARLDPSVIAELVPCSGPVWGGAWKNHGQYVSAVAIVTEMLETAGLISAAEQSAYVSAAAHSSCGRR